MTIYIETIKTAIIFFPIIAFIITLPYMLIQYHKYGAIYFFRTIIVYSFVLYLLVAYFLVILPLPSIEEVRNLTTARWQLIPFTFISDILNAVPFQINNFQTYWNTIKTYAFFQAFFNVLLCLPFGVYLHYYFKCTLKQTILYTFLLSLFFELTQLTGLYFIYPRGYRLFDVDDLMLNTLGGIVGYYVGNIVLKFLPNREKIDEKSFQLGTKVSFLRRSMAFFIDLFLVHFLYGILKLILKKILHLTNVNNWFYVLCLITYYIIIPILKNNQTYAHRFLNLQLASSVESQKVKWYQIALFQCSFYFEYLGSITIILSILSFIQNNHSIEFSIFIITTAFAYLMIYIISITKKILGKPLLYEKISKVTLKSTITTTKKELEK